MHYYFLHILKIDDPLVEIDVSARPESAETKPESTISTPKLSQQPKTETEIEKTSTTTDGKAQQVSTAAAAAAPSKAKPKTDFGITTGRNQRHVKLSRMRLKIAERLKASQNTTASLTTFNEIDCTNIMNVRLLIG